MDTVVPVSWKVKRALEDRKAAMMAEHERSVTFDEVLRVLLARDDERRAIEATS